MYSGLSVGEVSESETMRDSVLRELQSYWPMERELLAGILEMLHVLVLTTQRAHGGKNLPKPLSIERPTDLRTSRPTSPRKGPATVISMSEFVARDRRGDL